MQKVCVVDKKVSSAAMENISRFRKKPKQKQKRKSGPPEPYKNIP